MYNEIVSSSSPQFISDILFGVVLISVILIGTTQKYFSKYLYNMIFALINSTAATKLYNEANYDIKHGASRLQLSAILMSALYVSQILIFYNIDSYKDYGTLFPGAIIVISILLVLRHTLWQLSGRLFNRSEVIDKFLFYNMLQFKIIGIILIFINLFSLFSIFATEHQDILFIVSFYLLGTTWAITSIRAINILVANGISIFYLFLYLCTLEILPTLICIRFLSGL